MNYYKELDLGWQKAFSNAWESFKINSMPIGCAIQNENNETVSSGKNMIYSKFGNGIFLNNKLAHAEMNALILLNEEQHPNIRKYILYTTLEPCILCFGAIAIGNIRNVKFAARDRYAGATLLNKIHEYTNSKHINIEGPIKQLEYFQICLQSYYELKNDTNSSLLLFEKDCKNAVEKARELFEDKILDQYINKNKCIEWIYNKIIEEMK